MIPIPGYEGRYSVCPDGRIYSHRRELHMTSHVGNHGYLIVKLFDGERKSTQTVHKLVALAYYGERPPGDIHVNHKDGNKLNNRPENLEYVTRSKNCKHAVKHGLSKVPLRKDDVFPLIVLGRLAKGMLVREVADSLGVAKHTICRIKNGHTYADVTGIKRRAAS